jgi:hypothetical protein
MRKVIKGSITPGKLADFVVLSDDPHTASDGTVATEKIKTIEIVPMAAEARAFTSGKWPIIGMLSRSCQIASSQPF